MGSRIAHLDGLSRVGAEIPKILINSILQEAPFFMDAKELLVYPLSTRSKFSCTPVKDGALRLRPWREALNRMLKSEVLKVSQIQQTSLPNANLYEAEAKAVSGPQPQA